MGGGGARPPGSSLRSATGYASLSFKTCYNSQHNCKVLLSSLLKRNDNKDQLRTHLNAKHGQQVAVLKELNDLIAIEETGDRSVCNSSPHFWNCQLML